MLQGEQVRGKDSKGQSLEAEEERLEMDLTLRSLGEQLGASGVAKWGTDLIKSAF